MSSELCIEIKRSCEECWEMVTACVTHDEYLVCEECGHRQVIDAVKLRHGFNLIFKEAMGEKPNKPENN